MSQKNRKLIHYDIDKMFNTEDREPNWYYGIYKINMLIAGGSGSGKTYFLINELINNVFYEPDDDVLLCLFLPQETYEGGTWDGFMRDYKNKLEMDNVNIVVFDISRGKTFKDFSVKKQLRDSIPVVDGFPDLDTLKSLKKEVDTKNKTSHKVICVFDDFISNFTKQDWAKYYRYLHNISRLSGTTISCIQSTNNIPPPVRGSYTVIVIFGAGLNESQLRIMIKNFVSLGLDKNQVDLLIRMATSQKARAEHIPLTLIGSTAPQGENIKFGDENVDI